MVSFAGSSRSVAVDLSKGQWSYSTKIMALGDSITSGFNSPPYSGYREPLWNLFQSRSLKVDFVGGIQDGDFADPDHEGINGITAHELSSRVPDLMTRYKPNVVLLMIGSNDISAAGESPSQLKSEIKGILDKIHAKLPSTTVFLSTLPPLGDGESGSDMIGAANQAIRAAVSEAASKGEKVKLVQPSLSTDDLVDGVHPDATGNAKIASAWYSAITKYLPSGAGAPGGSAHYISPYDFNISGSEADDRLVGSSYNNSISGRGGDDAMWGGSGNDRLSGGSGNDKINGGSGNDVVSGSSGDDRLNGSYGNDTIAGGSGKDVLGGYTGYDVFDFNYVSDSGTDEDTRDVISDFSRYDKIDLSTIDANTERSGNQSFRVVSDFTGSAGELAWDRTDSGFIVYGDVDGDGNADLSIEVHTALSSLQSSYFRL